MEGLINVLKDQQNVITKGLTNFKKCSKDRLTLEYIETRQELLESDWALFKENNTKLYERYKAEDIVQKVVDIYDATEDTYVIYKSLMKTALNKIQLAKGSVRQTDNASASINKSSSSFVKLPKISIPIFSGKYDEWTTFHDLFTSLVHKNDTLDNVQRLHYLKGHLSGEAEQLIRHTPITDANYVQCWTQLQKRYSNKKYLTNCILRRLFGQKRMQVESATALKELLDTTCDCLNALSNLDINVSTWDVIIIHIATFKLDNETRKQWELSICNNDSNNDLPTFNQFKTFIENRFRALECLEPKRAPVHQGSNNNKGSVAHTPKAMLATSSSIQCEFCSEGHKLCFCKKFSKETVDVRRDFVAKHKICFNCLGGNHIVSECKKPTTCKVCQKRHHSLLHLGQESDKKDQPSTSSAIDSVSLPNTDPIVSCLSTGNIPMPRQVLLATALIKAESRSGEFQTVRALLDQGSQACFVTEAVVQLLNLKKNPIQGTISGLGGNSSTMARYMVHLNIQSRVDSNYNLKVNAYVLNKITSYLPECRVNTTLDWLSVNTLQLADPEFNTPNKIDILLGADAYSCIIKAGIVKSPSGTLIAQSTTLGWVLSGAVSRDTSRSSPKINVLHAQVNEDEILRKREIEEQNSSKKLLTPKENRCKELYTKTTVSDGSGRYVMRLPFRYEVPSCKAGSSHAEKRVKSLEKRLERNTDLKEKYKQEVDSNTLKGQIDQIRTKDNMEKDNINKDNINKDNINKDNINKDNINKDNMNKDNINKDNINKNKMKKDNINKNNTNKYKIIQDIKQAIDYNKPKQLDHKEKEVEIKLDSTIKILELTWNRNADTFQYMVNLPPPTTAPLSKRSIISMIARLFYPLGWLAPSVDFTKVFIQKLWLAGVGWDEELTNDLINEWRSYREELLLLTKVRNPRWLGIKSNDYLERHGFSDASETAYLAVIYLRIANADGNVQVSLLHSCSTDLKEIILNCSFFDQFCQLRRLVRFIAYCQRFLKEYKIYRKVYLQTTELDAALECSIRKTQEELFTTEYTELKDKGYIQSKPSSLRSLCPYLDGKNIMRVRGRLEKLELSEQMKHPIVLPLSSHLTRLIIADAHHNTLHGSSQLMISYLSTTYWILGVRNVVKHNVIKCVTCAKQRVTLTKRYKWSSQVAEPKIGDIVLVKDDDLPPSRWLMGRIVQKRYGKDNVTRVFTLRTKSSTIKRPTSKICILPVVE